MSLLSIGKGAVGARVEERIEFWASVVASSLAYDVKHGQKNTSYWDGRTTNQYDVI